MAEAIAIVGLVDACISLTKTIIAIGQAAKNAKGIPEKVQNVFEQVPALLSLFKRAKRNDEKNKISDQSRLDAEPILVKCESALTKWKDLFEEICPKDDKSRPKDSTTRPTDNTSSSEDSTSDSEDGTSGSRNGPTRLRRFWNATKNQVTGRNSKVFELWEEIDGYVKTLETFEVFRIGDKLDGLNEAMEALADERQGKYSHSGSGDLNHTENSGSGHMNIQQGGAKSKFTQRIVMPQPEKVKRARLVPRQANPRFQGYSHILEKIVGRLLQPGRLPPKDDQTDRTMCVVLQGMGGVGKSEVVLQFLANNQSKIEKSYWGVFWVDCETELTAAAGFKGIAKCCGWPTDSKGITDFVFSRLDNRSNSKRSILILDNCDNDQASYGRYIPNTSKVDVLMTTRLTESEMHATTDQVQSDDFINLDGLTEEDAVNLVFRICKFEKNAENQVAARCMVKTLDCHPLAITVASSLVRDGSASLLTYADDFNERRTEQKKLLKERRSEARYKRIDETFEVTARALETRASTQPECQDALELLGVLAFLDRTSIPEDIFSRAWAYENTVLEREHDANIRELTSSHVEQAKRLMGIQPPADARVPPRQEEDRIRRFRAARRHLSELSLVKWDPKSRAVSLHSLIHVWARDRIQDTEIVWNTSASILALSTEEDQRWTPFTGQLQRHIESIYSHDTQKGSHFGTLHRCKLYWPLLWQLYRASSSKGSEVSAMLLAQTKSLYGKCQEAEQVGHATFLNAMFLPDEAPESITVWEDIVRYGEQILPEDHRDLLSSQHNLARAYLDGDQLAKSIELFEHVVQVKNRVLGDEEHSDRLGSQHMLARAYLEEGRVPKAIELLEHVVQVRNRILEGEEHPDRLVSQHNLARAYLEGDQLAKSIELFEHVVQVKNRVLGEEHPRRLVSQHELARAYLEGGQVPKAVELLEHVVRVESKVLEEDNPEQLASQYELAKAYLDDGQVPKAIELLEHVVRVENSLLGEEHPNRLSSEHTLAFAYLKDFEARGAGQIDEAIRLLEHVVKAEVRILPKDDKSRMSSEDLLKKACKLRQRSSEGTKSESWWHGDIGWSGVMG